jgi:hypothetical protein
VQLVQRPAVIAVIASVVLVLGVVELQNGSSVAGVSSIDEPTAANGGTEGGNGDSGDPTVAASTESSTDAPADGSSEAAEPSGDATGDATADGDGADSDSDGQDGGESASTGVQAPNVEALALPAVGTYQYDSSGSWQLNTDVPNELPPRSEGTVSGGDGRWGFTLVAGPNYSDSFVFTLDDAGLDWTGWSLDRTFFDAKSTTVYSCGSTDPFFVANSERGRNIQHACNGPGGIRSEGPVISDGYKVLDLADGTEVTTVHLVYEYTVSSADIDGEGKIELWMDPTTGLRVQELRSITSRSYPGTVDESVYTEDVRFTLRSMTPA